MILIVGGTAEAHDLAKALGARALTTLAGAAPAQDYGGPVRSGGFGGASAQRAFMVAAGISVVVDASHGFAAQIGPRTQALAQDLGLPVARLLRPNWQPEGGDTWVMLDNLAEAAAHLDATSTTFLALGHRHLPDLSDFPGRLILRGLVPPKPPFSGLFLQAAPGDAASELALFAQHKVTHVLTRNSGGTRAKLDAARQLGLGVLMLRRPITTLPGVPCFQTTEETLAWLSTV